MDAISLENVANIITFLAPGYFAIQIYALVYAKRERDFSRLIVESVVYSLPIVAGTNFLWKDVFQQGDTTALNPAYASVLVIVAVVIGGLATFARTHWPIRDAATKLGLGSPDEDFVKTQFLRIDAADPDKNIVLVRLKSSGTFAGTIDRLSRYNHDGAKYYCFSNLAWLTEQGRWQKRDGSILVERSEIEYIETPRLKD